MDLGSVDTNLLLALRALLRECSVSRAARTLGLAQSSISHALARLRRHFQDRLLVPAGRDLVLTQRAKTLVEPVEAAFAQLERVFAPGPDFHPATSPRTFHVAAPDNLELYVLPRLAP